MSTFFTGTESRINRLVGCNDHQMATDYFSFENGQAKGADPELHALRTMAGLAEEILRNSEFLRIHGRIRGINKTTISEQLIQLQGMRMIVRDAFGDSSAKILVMAYALEIAFAVRDTLDNGNAPYWLAEKYSVMRASN